MSFDAPLFLAGLALIPLLAVLYVRGERRPREPFAAPALMPSVVRDRPRWRRHAPVAGYGLAVAALLVALARPQTTVAVPVEQATVAVVSDRSGSMLAKDVVPTRLEAARRAADTFLGTLPKDVRVGAIAFNHLPRVIASPTRDHAAVRDAIDSVQAAGSTATGDALDAALRMIARAARPGAKPPPAAIVLLSDGKSVRGSNPLEIARKARQAKVPVYAVALGTAGGTIESRRADGSVRQVAVPPDPDTLRQIAQITGGQSFAVDDAEQLKKVYERLGRQVATEKRPREVTGMFAGGALLVMAVAAAGSLRWFGRPI